MRVIHHSLDTARAEKESSSNVLPARAVQKLSTIPYSYLVYMSHFLYINQP